MYNKIFTKILDSSIWLETDATRIVWMTLLAAMDEDGFCQFASVANLAHRARVTLERCDAAVTTLENPDSNSSDPDNDGRRIERVPGGWMVLNATKYRELVTRVVSREKTRVRVANYRARNAHVTESNEAVTPSEAYTEAKAEAVCVEFPFPSTEFKTAWEDWIGYRKEKRIAAYTPRGIKAQFSRFKNWGESRTIAAITFSMAQNYQGIFEPDQNNARMIQPKTSAGAARLNAF